VQEQQKAVGRESAVKGQRSRADMARKEQSGRVKSGYGALMGVLRAPGARVQRETIGSC
jgi:hypothetical protein